MRKYLLFLPLTVLIASCDNQLYEVNPPDSTPVTLVGSSNVQSSNELGNGTIRTERATSSVSTDNGYLGKSSARSKTLMPTVSEQAKVNAPAPKAINIPIQANQPSDSAAPVPTVNEQKNNTDVTN